MIDIYSVVLLVLLLAVGFCCILAGRKKNEYSATLLKLYVSGVTSVLFYVLFLQSSSETAATFFVGIYYIGIDWVLLFLMRFIMMYTNTRFRTGILKYFFLTLTLVDTVMLLLNNGTGHALTVELAQWDGMPYWDINFHFLQALHLGLCYTMSALIVGILINRILRSPKLYRKLYIYILGVFAVVLCANIVGYMVNLPVDLSPIFYVVEAIYCYYFLLYASPKGLVESILANVVEDIGNGIVCFDLSSKCIYANTKARELLGVSESQVGTLVDSFYMKWLRSHPQDSLDYECWDREYSVEGEEHQFHIEFQRLKEERGSTIGYFYKMTDKTAEMKAFQEEQYLATHDRLTGLYNKEYFFQKAEEIIRRNPEKERYMVCADIKNFRLLNDLFGEEMGDKILVAQAALLKYTNYEDCIQGRISGEKFAMLITRENFNAEMTVKNTGRLQYLIDGRNYKLNVTMGVYNITDPEESAEAMYEKACMAAEAQQGDYQKTVVYYDTKMLQQLLQEKNVADEFEEALKTKQFRMFLQPMLDAEGRLVGAEALARWQHPQRGLVFPVDFISVVEKTMLISRLDEYMWELAAEKLKEWEMRGILDVSISVNMSGKDFYYIDIFETLVSIVQKYDVNPANMKLEISETELLSDAEPQIAELNKLQEYGFGLRIDDFGKGYSSLNTLQKVRANSLKIDLRLVEQGLPPEKKRSILNAIITMAKALDMEVITDSLETEDEVSMLRELGCDVFQGRYFSRPLPVEEFEEKYMKEQ